MADSSGTVKSDAVLGGHSEAGFRLITILEHDTCRSAFELLASAQERENTLISHRMTWLMTLNGFIVAASALLVVNRDEFADQVTEFKSWGFLITGVSVVGLISNMSTLYSNYWADRAMQEADAAFMNVVGKHIDETIARSELRLAGRDPANMPSKSADGAPPRPGPFWSPLGKFLHPWFSLPLTFCIAFFSLPGFEVVAHPSFWRKFGAQLAIVGAFAVILALSHFITPRSDLRRLREDEDPLLDVPGGKP